MHLHDENYNDGIAKCNLPLMPVAFKQYLNAPDKGAG